MVRLHSCISLRSKAKNISDLSELYFSMVWSRVVKFGRCERPLGCAFCCSCENLPKFGLGISLWKTRTYVKTHVRTSAIRWNSPIILSSRSLVLLSHSVPLPGSGVSIRTSTGPSADTRTESRATVSSELPVFTLLATTEKRMLRVTT